MIRGLLPVPPPPLASCLPPPWVPAWADPVLHPSPSPGTASPRQPQLRGLCGPCPKQGEDDDENARPLAESLLLAIADLLFCPDFTVQSHRRSTVVRALSPLPWPRRALVPGRGQLKFPGAGIALGGPGCLARMVPGGGGGWHGWRGASWCGPCPLYPGGRAQAPTVLAWAAGGWGWRTGGLAPHFRRAVD